MNINQIYNKIYGSKNFHEGEYTNYVEKTIEEKIMKGIHENLNLQNGDKTENKINNQIKF